MDAVLESCVAAAAAIATAAVSTAATAAVTAAAIATAAIAAAIAAATVAIARLAEIILFIARAYQGSIPSASDTLAVFPSASDTLAHCRADGGGDGGGSIGPASAASATLTHRLRGRAAEHSVSRTRGGRV